MSVRRALIALCLAVSPVALAAAPVPKEQLLKPPANADHYVVVSDAGKHGDMWRWALPDGELAYRHSQSLRGWITETDQVDALGADGLPTKVEVRGITPNGDAAETFTIANGKAVWTSTADSGSSRGPHRLLSPGRRGRARQSCAASTSSSKRARQGSICCLAAMPR